MLHFLHPPDAMTILCLPKLNTRFESLLHAFTVRTPLESLGTQLGVSLLPE